MVHRNSAPPPRTRKEHVLDAARHAKQVRRELGILLTDPVTAAEAAQKLGVEVLYKADVNSMEGLYLRDPKPRIVVSSLRPVGRQAFTIGHELGHHVYQHKGHLLSVGSDNNDEDENEIVKRFNPEEVLADAFSSHFLLPKMTVMNAFKNRGLSYDTCTPQDVYAVAWWFGVGYETLIRHMQTTLTLLTSEKAAMLRKQTPKKIRAAILGEEISEDLIPIDCHWNGTRAVDAQVGDLILLPQGTTLETGSGNACLLSDEPEKTLVKAISPGTTRLEHRESGWAVYLRVARREYAGLARYRFMAEEEELHDVNTSTHC